MCWFCAGILTIPRAAPGGLVGGKLDEGESEIAAAEREAREEIGYQLEPSRLKFIKTYQWDREDGSLTFNVFWLKVEQGKVPIELDHTESTDYLWASPRLLYARKDLMMGLYPILNDVYQVGKKV